MENKFFHVEKIQFERKNLYFQWTIVQCTLYILVYKLFILCGKLSQNFCLRRKITDIMYAFDHFLTRIYPREIHDILQLRLLLANLLQFFRNSDAFFVPANLASDIPLGQSMVGFFPLLVAFACGNKERPAAHHLQKDFICGCFLLCLNQQESCFCCDQTAAEE